MIKLRGLYYLYLFLFLCVGFLYSCSTEKKIHSTTTAVVKENDALDKPVKKPKHHLALEDKERFCHLVDKSFKKYRWGKSYCMDEAWENGGRSVLGTPLVWSRYGSDDGETTLIMCGVHGDEITPIKFCFDIIGHLKDIKTMAFKDDHFKSDFKNARVIVVPIANPDSFFKKRPTRTNANGVDVNRNLPTGDFKAKAMKLWKTRYRSDKRRYPGKVAMSEPESVFQVELIEKFKPRKIISVHAPLTMLDYDGPASENSGGHVGLSANELLITMSSHAKGYRIKNYPFFPGSLGNYAGNERQIPTFTLELPTSDPSKSKRYWRRFKKAIHAAMIHKIN